MSSLTHDIALESLMPALSICIKTSPTLIAPDLGQQCSPLQSEAHGEGAHTGSDSKPHPLPTLPGSLLE